MFRHTTEELSPCWNSLPTCKAVEEVGAETTPVPKVPVPRRLPFTPWEHTPYIIVSLANEVPPVPEEPGSCVYIHLLVHIEKDPDMTSLRSSYAMPNLPS